MALLATDGKVRTCIDHSGRRSTLSRKGTGTTLSRCHGAASPDDDERHCRESALTIAAVPLNTVYNSAHRRFGGNGKDLNVADIQYQLEQFDVPTTASSSVSSRASNRFWRATTSPVSNRHRFAAAPNIPRDGWFTAHVDAAEPHLYRTRATDGRAPSHHQHHQRRHRDQHRLLAVAAGGFLQGPSLRGVVLQRRPHAARTPLMGASGVAGLCRPVSRGCGSQTSTVGFPRPGAGANAVHSEAGSWCPWHYEQVRGAFPAPACGRHRSSRHANHHRGRRGQPFDNWYGRGRPARASKTTAPSFEGQRVRHGRHGGWVVHHIGVPAVGDAGYDGQQGAAVMVVATEGLARPTATSPSPPAPPTLPLHREHRRCVGHWRTRAGGQRGGGPAASSCVTRSLSSTGFPPHRRWQHHH